MGVIPWNEDQQQPWFWLPREEERPLSVSGSADVRAARARTYREITRAKLEGWLPLGELPCQAEPHSRSSRWANRSGVHPRAPSSGSASAKAMAR